jgi:hypothetical protein
VLRYSNDDDIVALNPGSDGNMTSFQTLPGANQFKDPLDLVQDDKGGLYVSEYDQLGNGPEDHLPQAGRDDDDADRLPAALVAAVLGRSGSATRTRGTSSSPRATPAA